MHFLVHHNMRLPYMSHKMNLVMKSLFGMPMVSKLEDILQILYMYFSSSLNTCLKFLKLLEIMEIKGLKIFWIVKTRWINMLPPLKHVWK